MPNFGGIVLSAKQLKIMQGLYLGINDIYEKYKKTATEYQFKKWSENFLWFFIAKAYSKTKYLNSDDELETARLWLADWEKRGVLDRPPYKWAKKVREQICDFIGKCKL
jgi:hypothetical protein